MNSIEIQIPMILINRHNLKIGNQKILELILHSLKINCVRFIFALLCVSEFHFILRLFYHLSRHIRSETKSINRNVL